MKEEKGKEEIPEISKSKEKKIKQKIDKKSVYFVLFFVVFLLVVLVYFVARPQIKRVYSKRDGFEEKKIRLEQMKTTTSKVNDFINLAQAVDQEGDVLNNVLIDKNDPVYFIEIIERVAKEEGVEISISQYTPPKKKKKPALKLPGVTSEESQVVAPTNENVVWLRLAIKSNYKSFLGFYYKLENMKTIFSVDSVDISKTITSRGLNNNEQALDESESVVIISMTTQ